MLMMSVIVLKVHNYLQLQQKEYQDVLLIVLMIMSKEKKVPTLVNVKILMKYIFLVLMVIKQVVMVNV